MGSSLPLSWSGADGTGQVDITVSSSTQTSFATASCVVPDTGTYAVPAAVTSALLPGASFFASVERVRQVQVAPASSGVLIYVTLLTDDDATGTSP